MFLTEEEKEVEWNRNHRCIVERCPKCHGKGFIERMSGTYETSVRCDCIKIAKMNVQMLDWGFPRKFLNPRWNLDMLTNKQYYEDIKDYIDNFEQYYSEGKGLFLYGAHGIGKTTISCIIAKEIVKKQHIDYNDGRHYVVAFAMYDDIMRKSFASDTGIKNKLEQFLRKSDLLIIDNVGNEVGKNEKQTAQRYLEMILRHRDNDCLPTILTSNYNLKEVHEEYNVDVYGFIKQNDKIIFVFDDNYRIAEDNVDDNVF